jgi:tight adherence protein B
MDKLILLLVFITVLLLTESLYFLLKDRSLRAPKRVRQRLKENVQASSPEGKGTDGLLKSRSLSEIPGLDHLLSRFQSAARLEAFLARADSKWTVGRFALTTLLIATGTLFIAYHLIGFGMFSAFILGLAAGSLPTLFLSHRKRGREKAFEEQLPDLLDLMARALRAGHSLSGAIQFAGQESPDPAGREFRRVSEEINFGMDLPVALRNLGGRIDCYDLRYLVTAITIHRETGGNLGDVLDRLAYTIRERVKLVRQTEALTAEGRLSGRILIILPFVMAGVLYVVQPTYILILFNDPTGRMMMGLALLLQGIGYLLIRKMVHPEAL